MKTGLLVIGILVFLSACTQSNTTQSSSHQGVEVVMYKSPTCGCCGEYGKYLEAKGFKVKTIEVENPLEIKRGFGVPEDMYSCHTLKIGNYYVEGHVPVEAIYELLDENPQIDGIALPGMPQGSPGMPGVKEGPFVIYSVSKGEVREFTRL